MTSHDSRTVPPVDLSVCPRCASRLMQPFEWHEAGPDRWRVRLRCPECEWIRDGVHGEAAVTRLDEELDRRTDALVHDLEQLARTNMEDEVERFCRALQDDHILAEDF